MKDDWDWKENILKKRRDCYELWRIWWTICTTRIN